MVKARMVEIFYGLSKKKAYMFILHRFILHGFKQRSIGTAPINSVVICNTDG